MLFSRKDVADFIHRHFEPAWQSVRAVPIVRIDFGDGNVITRTLHGNIATYACTADGRVLDVLPGIYAPNAYRFQLNQLCMLARFVDQEGVAKRAERLALYHKAQEDALRKNGTPDWIVYDMKKMDLGKTVSIERNLKFALFSQTKVYAGLGVEVESPDKPPQDPEELANWKLLEEDTKINNTVRRRHIHEKLANCGLVAPDAISKWLYKDVLHADLDDPYLGLRDVLFANYPFKNEGKPSNSN